LLHGNGTAQRPVQGQKPACGNRTDSSTRLGRNELGGITNADQKPVARNNAPSQKMFKFNDQGAFDEAKRKVSLMIEEVRQESPEDADYLEEHMVFDEKT